MRKYYNKLIRDRIPEIIRDSGCQYALSELSETEYLAALKQKLIEEATEAASAPPGELLKELADLYEVIDVLMAIANIDREELLAEREKRKKERGGFEKRLKLLWAQETQ